MPKQITRTVFQCQRCFKEFQTDQESVFCETECALGKHYNTKEEWEKDQPYCTTLSTRKNTLEHEQALLWSSWSAYGLVRGW